MFAVCLISPLQNIGGWFALVLGLEGPLITPTGCLDPDCWRVRLCRGVDKCCLLAAGLPDSSSSDSESAVDVDGVGPRDELRSSVSPRRRFWRANRSFSSWARSDRKLVGLAGASAVVVRGGCCGRVDWGWDSWSARWRSASNWPSAVESSKLRASALERDEPQAAKADWRRNTSRGPCLGCPWRGGNQ